MILRLFLILLLLPMATVSGQQVKSNDPWVKIDSLIDLGLVQTAQEEVQEIYARAKSKNDKVQMLKAQLYELKCMDHEEEADVERIRFAKQEAEHSAFPYNAIWSSITAQLYWRYYQENRWDILQRSNTVEQSDDFSFWSAQQFYSEVRRWYTRSLHESERLQQVHISTIDPILVKGRNTEHLRPTVYDLLVFRAIGFFQNEEKDITSAAYSFSLDDPDIFLPATRFVQLKLNSEDSTSGHANALQLYQQVLQFHLNDEKPDALIDADLQRLQFVYKYAAVTDKKERYQKALQQIVDAYPNEPLAGMAAYRISELLVEEQYVLRKGRKMIDRDLPAVLEQLQRIGARFPNSEAAKFAEVKISEIKTRTLFAHAEEVILPNVPSRILLGYRNINQAHFKVVRIECGDELYPNRVALDSIAQRLQSLPSVLKWVDTLPGTADMEEHTTEVKVDPLSTGCYWLVVSELEDISVDGQEVTAVAFQVSDLSILTVEQSPELSGFGYVVDRRNGKPIPQAHVSFYQRIYNNKANQYDYRRVGSSETKKDGSFSIPSSAIQRIVVRHKDRVLFQNGYFSGSVNDRTHEASDRTFFFTDRSIYRPGQTVYFKAIVLRTTDSRKKNEVVGNKETEVVLYDVNGEELQKQRLRTNEFGSVHGTFIIPESGLTGEMEIANEWGSCNIFVEAYKRPRFQVLFDSLSQAYALNDTVRIVVRAEAYAGNAVDGATVRYRVVRQTIYPYHWMFGRINFPNAAETEIKNGLLVTGMDGSGAIYFPALPDKSADTAASPYFQYTIHVDVIDLNGETRSNSQSLNIGYRSLRIITSIPDKAMPKQLDSISVSTLSLNGDFVAAPLRLRVFPLRQPAIYFRERLWESPDQFLMDEATFRKYFPQDVYKEEHLPQNWERPSKPIYEYFWTSSDQGKVGIPVHLWSKGGWYLIEIETVDKGGHSVVERKYVEVVTFSGDAPPPYGVTCVPDGSSWQPGQRARVWLSSGIGTMHWMRTVQSSGRPAITWTETRSTKPATWAATIQEEDRGGVQLTWLSVYENRVYQQKAFLSVPWTNKELDIAWETHRDKLQPGAQETWTMVVRGAAKERVAAEMVASLYDASLDQIMPHRWSMGELYPSNYLFANWRASGFGFSSGLAFRKRFTHFEHEFVKQYDELLSIGWGRQYFRGYKDKVNIGGVRSGAPPIVEIDGVVVRESESSLALSETTDQVASEYGTTESHDVRTNLNETAFFYPQLRTDSQGNIRISFTMPEAITKWQLLAYAHTTDMRQGVLEGTVITQKDVMVTPGLPRFFRQGDKVVVTAKISSLTQEDLDGEAEIEVLDLLTGKPLQLAFRMQELKRTFRLPGGSSTVVSWEMQVPESQYHPVIVRMIARAGSFTDGESHTLPVVSNRMLITETLPLWMNGSGAKQYRFEQLLQSGRSKTLAPHRVTVEYTSNPAWYVVQALPYLAEYPYECAEQVFNRFYANALAGSIIAKASRLQSVFNQWKQEDTSALMSNLQKNKELKTALLEETPWVLEAKDESLQKKQIAQLFETHQLSKSLDATRNKLERMMLPEGAFPWFAGSTNPDRYITQYIATGLGRLHKLGIQPKGIKDMSEEIVKWLDQQILNDYKKLQQTKADISKQQINRVQVQYLYMRSFFAHVPIGNKEVNAAVSYYQEQASKYWSSFNPYMKGMIALALYRGGEMAVPKQIIQTLRETAIQQEERGIYWMKKGNSWWWHEAPIEAQALLIECFDEIAQDKDFVDGMRLWLLKEKQTQNWGTTRATADACYAFLLQGTNWLEHEPKVTISLGNVRVDGRTAKNEAGTGYFKTSFGREEINPDMGNIRLSVTAEDTSLFAASYGAVYWQYFEHLDKIAPASSGTPLAIRKQLFITRNTDRGAVLEPVNEGNTLKVGDKLISRIEIIADRDMEYVHLKDMRGAGFEPVNVLSGYRWQGALGYYESTGDLASNFFISYLPKGKYVFEYPMFVTNKGEYSVGIATLQCMYAPEFSSHSEGIRVNVQ